MEHLDFWAAVFTLGALAYYVLLPQSWRAAIAGGLKWGIGQVVSWREESTSAESTHRRARPSPGVGRSRARSRGFRQRSRVQNAAGARSGQQDADSSSVQRSAFSVQRSADAALLPASMEELQALAEAIRLRSSGEVTRKQDAIERAFGITKGGGDGWRRASRLYDVAMARSSPAREVETA